MRLSEPLISSGRVMLQSGRALRPTDIEALNRRYPGLCVRIGDPILDSVIEFEDDAPEREVAFTAQRRIADSMCQVRERFNERASLRGTDFEAMHSAVDEMMRHLKGHATTAALLVRCLDSESYLTMHTGNVFYLSILLGSATRDYVTSERQRQTIARGLHSDFASDLAPLGVGAMFIDLGMLPLDDLITSNGPLSDADRQAISEHPDVGADMLPAGLSAVARMIVRTHHENFDGSGYPNRIPGDKVHVFTRLVRIADAFDAATAQRVYKKAKSPARTLWEMSAGPYRRFYDPHLMKAFCKLIQPFPIGAKIRLSDGRYAVVVRYNRRNPCAPCVIIAFDPANKPLPQSQIQGPLGLEDHPDLRLKSFQDEDLSYLYKTDVPDAPVPQMFRTMYEAAYP